MHCLEKCAMASKKDMEELKRSNEDLRKSVEFMSHQMESMTIKQDSIMDMIKEIKELKRLSKEKDVKIDQLENRLSDLEQYTRLNDVIITGLPTKPRSYAGAARSGVVTRGSEPSDQEDTVQQQVIEFLQKKHISINENDIEACHPLSQKDKSRPAVIIMRFANRKFKTNLLRQGRMLKGSNVYLNEHLTKTNADIAKRARFLRREEKIQATWSSNCKIYIKLNGTPEQARVVMVRRLDELDKFA